MLVGHQENGGGGKRGYATRARVGVPLLFVRAGGTAASAAAGDAASSRQDIKRRGACDDAGRNNSNDNGKNEYRVSVAVMTVTVWVGAKFAKDKHSRMLCCVPIPRATPTLHHASKRVLPHWEVIKSEKVTT